ncbi:redoxin domain-containing protein [Mangrovivirga sp. M17]|uniref:Redoxin domain-containing protein n=1 Tax=Mangrovivirga halotolerans TaxID=2993936 RepID=A0ABT3RW85_9BACT|nr:redoxin domain-containing protein [Mangrovivirga halotolerans]MCX2746044.1 redoxin domain-containing protein [Mangrovivirga halotolerans]
MKKKLFFAIWLTFLLSVIAIIFYRQEYRFLMPTPKPADLKEINQGDSVSLEKAYSSQRVYFHFYNSECPCSRFNIKDFKRIVGKNADSVKFIAVIEEKQADKLEEFREKYDLGIETVIDKGGKIAKELGVYSTPQAVIIENGKVFYKGNYNKARFCTSKNTRFAELALEALLENKNPPSFPELAYITYGCELPSNQ